MAYLFTVTVNFDILCDCHIEASSKPGELESMGLDPENAIQEIDIAFVKNKNDYLELHGKLQKELKKYHLEAHEDHFLYLFYLFYEIDAPYFILKEDEVKHAAGRVKKLIELQRIKEQCATKDIVVSIKTNLKDLSVLFDTPIIIDYIWEDLYNSLLAASISSGSNFLLIEFLKDKEITLELLKEVSKKLKFRTGSFWNKALANFSSMLLYYLNKLEIFKSDSKLSSEQARLIFDLLEAFSLLSNLTIDSEKDDYIKALLTNNKLL
jgi:hypothetical protein